MLTEQQLSLSACVSVQSIMLPLLQVKPQSHLKYIKTCKKQQEAFSAKKTCEKQQEINPFTKAS